MKITSNPKTNLLKAKLLERGIDVPEMAKLLGIDRATLYRNLNNIDRMPIGKAMRIKSILDLTDEEAIAIFLH